MPNFPLPENEAERLASLLSYNILDTAEDEDFDELTILASAICGTPISLISLVDDKRQWFKSHTGIDERETPKELSFCAHVIAGADEVVVIKDSRLDPRFADNALVTGDPHVIFYAGVPLINEEGFALGSLCVIDHVQRDLTPEQKDALKVLAKQVINKLELRKQAAELRLSNQQLLNSNTFIEKFAAMAAHDIKNPLSSMLLSSQALKMRLKKLNDDSCEKLIDLNITATNRVINLLDDMLHYSRSPESLLTKRQHVYFNDIIKRVMGMIFIPSNFQINLPVDNYPLNVSVIALEQMLINLFTNAIRYNDKENGVINVRFAYGENSYNFEVQDNGIGIDEQYHQKIFTSNFTLKTADRFQKQGTGIGLSTVKELVSALSGHITLTSQLGVGTTFFISLPK